MKHRPPITFLLIFFQITLLQSQTKVIEVNLNSQPLLASEHFKEISFVKLETSKECLLRYPATIIYDQDIIFVQDMQIYAFSNNGSFLNGFGRLGKGPGEYIFVNDFWVDKHKKILEIYSGSKINKYKYSGEFLESKPAFNGASFGKTLDGNYLFFNNYLPVLANNDNIRRTDQILVLADAKGNMIDELSNQIDHLGKFPGGGTPTSIGDYQGSLQIVVNRSSSVYQLNGTTLFQKYHFVFVPNNLAKRIPKEHEAFTEEEYIQYKGRNVIEINAFRESPSIATFWFLTKKGLYYAIYNKLTENVGIFPRDAFVNDINFLPFGVIMNIDNQIITTVLQASDFLDSIEKTLSNLNPQEKQQFIKLNSKLLEIYRNTRRDDNPILVMYHLK